MNNKKMKIRVRRQVTGGFVDNAISHGQIDEPADDAFLIKDTHRLPYDKSHKIC